MRYFGLDFKFQSSRPLRGATKDGKRSPYDKHISILAPLTGRDKSANRRLTASKHFNPRAPYGARRIHPVQHLQGTRKFQSSRPLRGATLATVSSTTWQANFNPRAPYGARRFTPATTVSVLSISILAPLTGRDTSCRCPRSCRDGFQSSRPLRGATTAHIRHRLRPRHFNPRAPYGARRQKYTKIACVFAITDKGQRLSPRQAPSVRTPDQEARGNRDKTRCEPSQKYRMLALRTTGSSAPQEDMFVCSQSVRSYSHTFSRDNKTEGCPFLRP